jgi:hypothetical protein
MADENTVEPARIEAAASRRNVWIHEVVTLVLLATKLSN